MATLIKDLVEEEKPREKAKKYGIEALSDVDLLALLFRTGKRGESVLDLSRKVLKKYTHLDFLTNLRYASLSSLKGIGEAKALSLLAALELGKRVYAQKENSPKFILESKDVYEKYHYLFDFETQEKFFCLYLNVKNQVIKEKVIFIGSANRSIVHARDIFREAILNNASKIICVHNHPSGVSLPSQEDITITKKLYEIGKFIDIALIDHIIMGKGNYYSFLESKHPYHAPIKFLYIQKKDNLYF